MQLTESSTLELKRKVIDDIRKTVIAFANSEGGTIYIGIDDDGTIVGVKDIGDEMLRLSNMIRDAIKPDVTMFVSYAKEKEKGKDLIKVIVQKGTECPYYLQNKGLRPEGVFVRQGASSVPATESSIRRMIIETDGDSYEEMRSLNQDLTFEAAAQEFKIRSLPFGANHLKTLHLVNEDGIYMNLGLLLSDQCTHTIKAAVFEGKEKAVFKDRREFTGSLLKQLNDVFAYISQYNRVRAEFNGLYRNDKKDYPEEALREALLNVLVHRDYAYSASTLISILDDRIEFISVGGLVKGINLSDIMLGVSVTRNERLANIFYRLTLIEAYGTGVPKILNSYKGFVAQPDIEVSDNAFKITLPNQNEQKQDAGTMSAENRIIELAERMGTLKRKDVEAKLNISQTMAGRILKTMVNKQLLEIVGQGKNTVYVLRRS
ncbi:MAG: AAA family ATPase [Syntrophomonadaceae bacterium]|nr:AAA family ATPase [Syntrophomonadaceae bacterium]